jgi:hypothetical protein
VVVAKPVTDLRGRLVADAGELALEEPRHRIGFGGRQHLQQGPQFDAVGMGADLLGFVG